MAVYQVEQINKVDVTKYLEGDLFLYKQGISILHNNKLEKLIKQSDLKDYVKKKDIKKLIEEHFKEGGK